MLNPESSSQQVSVTSNGNSHDLEGFLPRVKGILSHHHPTDEP